MLVYAVGQCWHAADTDTAFAEIVQYCLTTATNTSKKIPQISSQKEIISTPITPTKNKTKIKMEVQPNPSAITFSVYSELAFIPKDSSESKWYSPQEKTSFWQSLLADARRMKRAIQESSAEAAAPELLYECLGLEALLDREVMMEIARRKSAHVSAVLSEQSRQKSQGSCDVEELSLVSQASSHWNLDRAQRLAFAYISGLP